MGRRFGADGTGRFFCPTRHPAGFPGEDLKAEGKEKNKKGKNKKKKNDENKKQEFFKNVNKKLNELRDYVEKNAEYVGDNFVSEARSIHYDKKNVRSIYGKATPEQTEELMDEGIEVSTIPWVNKTNS